MKEMSIVKEKRQLLNSWTLELANWLITEHSLSRSEAFRKAHLTRQLLGMLGEGVVTFCYRKANGEERQARGTLCHGISDDFDHYEYKAEDGDTFANVLRRGVYVYFDLDCRSFRSFAARNLISLTPDPSPLQRHTLLVRERARGVNSQITKLKNSNECGSLRSKLKEN